MENMDPLLEQRVWQRVKGTGGIPAAEVMAAEAEWDSRAFRRLAGILTGNDRLQAKQLAEGCGRCAAVLRGAHWLLTGTRAAPAPVRQPESPPREALVKCYDHARSRLEQCAQWAGHPRVGPVFEGLCRQAGEQCGSIAGLLGSPGIK